MAEAGAWFRLLDVAGAFLPPASTPLAMALREGRSCRDLEALIERTDGTRRDVSVTVDPTIGSDGAVNGAVIVLLDISTRKNRSRYETLLSGLTDRLAQATTEADIVQIATRTIGEELQVQRCGFVENELATGTIRVTPGYLRDPVPSLAGRHDLSDLGTPEWQHAISRARIALADVTLHPLTAPYAAYYERCGVRSYAAAPFLRERRWVATLTVTNDQPREWTDEEMTLLDHVVARVWPLIERARSQSALQLVIGSAPVVLAYIDRDCRISFANLAFASRFGLSPAEVVGRTLAEVFGPESFARVVTHVERVLAGNAVQFDMEMPGGPQERRYVTVSYAPDLDPGGIVRGFLSAETDITERKQVEFALTESEKRFRLMASRAPVGIFMASPDGMTTFVNSSWCHMSGLTPDEAEGLGWMRAVHPDDRGRVADDWGQAVAKGISSKAEFRFVRPDGAITWVHGAAVQLRDTNGRLTGYVGTIADYTERKVAELALRESEERFRLLADNIVQFAWICDRNGQWLWINRRFQEYAGICTEDMNSVRATTIHHPDHLSRVTTRFELHLHSGEPWEDSFPLKGRDGLYRWFLSRAIPIRDEQGRITRWFGTNTDVTDLRETQDMLRKAQEELLAYNDDLERRIGARTASLREAIVQMEEFSYSVSHDLRAPLRAMNGYAEALVEDYGAKLDDTAREYLRRIQRSSQRMEKLTHDMLSYSRIARAEFELVPVDIGGVLRDVVGQYAELHTSHADLVISEPLGMARAHELSLGQCLGNLLTNAVKFVRPGSRSQIRVFTARAAGAVRIWVVDNGIGIKPEHQRNLFQMFERVPTPIPYDGTGIGLAIVRKAVEKMGGRYGVESDGVSGCRFWIELEAAD